MSIKVKNDNTGETISEMRAAAEKAMEIIGMKMEGYAKLFLTESDAVDTGRLRNSISHATRFDSKSKSYRWGDSSKGRDVKGGSDSTDPHSTPKELTAVVGTNVEYARFIELGSLGQEPRPYLKPSVTEHIGEYRQIIKKELKNE